MKKTKLISQRSRKWLNLQGYSSDSIVKISELAPGIRFAYLGCGLIITLGLILQSTMVLGIALSIAFLSVMLPNNPFDYLYNHVVRYIYGKPAIGPRSKQGKFACGIATVWIGTIIYLFSNGFIMSGYILGGILLAQVVVVSSTDICLISLIYNSIFKVDTKKHKLQMSEERTSF